MNNHASSMRMYIYICIGEITIIIYFRLISPIIINTKCKKCPDFEFTASLILNKLTLIKPLKIKLFYRIKCKGVLSAVMAIKHLASNSETCQKATEIFGAFQISHLNYFVFFLKL